MSKRILIVDDDQTLTAEVKLALEETGLFLVWCEEKGAQAFCSARKFRPDLILLDLMMPDVTGIEAAQQLKSDPTTMGIPIVFFTALASKEDVEAHLGVIGGYRFLAKPVRVEEIVGCINETLENGHHRNVA